MLTLEPETIKKKMQETLNAVTPLDFKTAASIVRGEKNGFVMMWRDGDMVTINTNQLRKDQPERRPFAQYITGHISLWEEALAVTDTLALLAENEELQAQVHDLQDEVLLLEEENSELEDSQDETEELQHQLEISEDNVRKLEDLLQKAEKEILQLEELTNPLKLTGMG